MYCMVSCYNFPTILKCYLSQYGFILLLIRNMKILVLSDNKRNNAFSFRSFEFSLNNTAECVYRELSNFAYGCVTLQATSSVCGKMV